jgi:thiosulfate reductase cytochrome b subunit
VGFDADLDASAAVVVHEPEPDVPVAAPAAPPPVAAARPVRARRAGLAVGALVGVVLIAAAVVGVARWIAAEDAVQSFLQRFPGTAPLPAGAPVGFPAWVAVSHLFNTILIVLIIRTGLQLRMQRRPPLVWSPSWAPERRVSITLWLHQSLDLLWLVNGVVYVVLLLVSGQWVRIVPTSWAVVPNAISALLQYATLDPPIENGWVDYNALQQLAYFAMVFVAAPIATITGLRMSAGWPRGSAVLNRIVRIGWVRPAHVGVMLFSVVFIVAHVVLVLATGALRNLDHMYALRGAVDPLAYGTDQLGLWLFIASLVVLAGAWLVTRPLLVAVVARRFGSVSER